MRIEKLSAVMGTLGLILGLGNTAYALVPTFVPGPLETYEFTASGDLSTNFNGSTITIDGTGIGAISAYNFFDDGTSYQGTGTFGSVASYNTTGWDGGFSFSIGDGLAATGNADFGVGDALTIGAAGDPPGIWAAVPGTVPDAGSTFELLMAGMGALGVYHRKHSRVK